MAMRGRSRASPVPLVRESWSDDVLSASQLSALGFLRNTAVVSHGRSPRSMWLVETATCGLAPGSEVVKLQKYEFLGLSRRWCGMSVVRSRVGKFTARTLGAELGFDSLLVGGGLTSF